MMKKLWISLALALILMMTTACSAPVEETPTEEPTQAATEAPTEQPSPETSPEAETEIFTIVGEEGQVRVGTTTIDGNVYYDVDENLYLPLAEVAGALGWTVDEPDAGGDIEMRLSRTGAQEIVIAYAKPENEKGGMATNLRATSGENEIELEREETEMPFLDGNLHVTESFFDKCVQEITVTVEGANVSIEARS